jgi:hypothetical protein
VVGNPPWVNWESLSDDYRQATRPLWHEYGLFSLRGHEARLGGGKKDLSMLMLYAAAQHYLRPQGTLAFLVTQTLFKSSGAGAGFRRLRLADSTPLGVRVVHDMTALQPFEGATNRTAAVVLERDAETAYPVRWVEWTTANRRRPRTDGTLAEALRATAHTDMAASPLRAGDATSPWLTATANAVSDLRGAIGKAAYRGYAGSYTGGLNGAYWIDVLASRTDGTLFIRNLHDAGKIKVERVETTIEPDLVYPLLRGRDVRRWRAAPSVSILLAQDPETRTGYPESWMRERLPLTYEYLTAFKTQIEARASRVVRDLMAKGAFYSMYAVGPYTIAPWKVVWREQASRMTAAVCGAIAGRPVIPDHKLMLVPVESDAEGHYLCAILNSPAVASLVTAYTTSTSISTHVLDHVRVPRFNPADPLHADLAALGAQAARKGSVDDAKLDALARRLWN